MKKCLFVAFFIVVIIAVPCFAQTAASNVVDPAARAKAARTLAADFESASYFPTEWAAAEALYAEAEGKTTSSGRMDGDGVTSATTTSSGRMDGDGVTSATTTSSGRMDGDGVTSATTTSSGRMDGDGVTSATTYNAAADAFTALSELAIPLYAQAREDEIMALRNDLVKAGARDRFPNYFSPADNAALQALDLYETKDYYTAKASAAAALEMFQVLTNAHAAWLIRQEIRAREFVAFDQANFDTAEKTIRDAMASYEAGNNAAALEKADAAYEQYHNVLYTGWVGYVDQRGSRAEAERQNALDNKANIASRNLFTEAESAFTAALEASAAVLSEPAETFNAKVFEDAANQYINAETLFITARESTIKKRAIAEQTMDEAHKKIAESEEIAKNAEIALRGGSHE